MTHLKSFKPSPTQQLVLNKYGWDTIERKVCAATIHFWRDIHNYFLGSYVPDNSDINIDYLYYDAILDYLFQNDTELQEDYEKELEE